MDTRVHHVLTRLNRMDSSDRPNHPGLRGFFLTSRLKIDTIATTRKIFSGQTSHSLHLPFSQSLVLFAVSGWDSLCSGFEVLGYRPEAYWLPPKTRNLKVKNVNLL